MNYLGIDYGSKRVGLSYADELGIALPLLAAVEATGDARLEHIAQVIKEKKIEAIVIGYPFNMDGSIGESAKKVDVFIKQLTHRFRLPVFKIDERLTSAQVEFDMESFRLVKKKKTIQAHQKERRTGDVDSRAATLILQEYLHALEG